MKGSDVMYFMTAYNEVFDDKNRVNPCGRLSRIKLISICKDTDPNTNFRDISTCIMKIYNMVSLKNKIKENPNYAR